MQRLALLLCLLSCGVPAHDLHLAPPAGLATAAAAWATDPGPFRLSLAPGTYDAVVVPQAAPGLVVQIEPEEGAEGEAPLLQGLSVAAGYGATIALAGVDVTGEGLACSVPLDRGPAADGAAHLVLREVALRRPRRLAVEVKGCDLRAEDLLVRDGSDGAVAIQGQVQYAISRSTFIDNSAPRRPLIWFDDASSGRLTDSVFAGNEARSGLFDCGQIPRVIAGCVFLNNPTGLGGGACVFQDEVR